MQPFPPPEYIRAIHDEMVGDALRPRRRRIDRERVRRRPAPILAIRRRVGQALVALGLRLDPSAQALLPRGH